MANFEHSLHAKHCSKYFSFILTPGGGGEGGTDGKTPMRLIESIIPI